MKYYTTKESAVHKTENFPLVYYPVDNENPGYYMMHHWHPEHEIIYVNQGKLRLCLDGTYHNLEKGEFAFVLPGVTHSATPYDCEYECVLFNLEELFGPWKADDKYIGGLLSHRLSAPEVYRMRDGLPEQAMHSLINILRNNEKGFELQAVGAVLDILNSLIKCNCLTESEHDYSPSKLKPFNKAITFIEQNFNQHITLEELSSHCSISSTYFSEYFKNITTMTPFDYINKYRVNIAAEMLLYTKKSITEIALSCGFNDLSYFSKTFRIHKGKTPRQYRTEYNRENEKNA